MRRGAVLAAVAALLAGCGGSSGRSEPAPLAVESRFETFVDPSRPTEAKGDVAGRPDRTFETQITYPVGAPGPYPLILFSHGSGVENPARYDALFRVWAGAGYVVAAPRYPLTSTSLPGAGADVVHQPADTSFVITEMVRRHGELVDGSRVAVAGHSLGAVTSLANGYNGCCADTRVKAVVALAGAFHPSYPADRWFAGAGPPLLVVHGDDDRVVRIEQGREVYERAPPPKAMLAVLGGDHSRPYGGSLATVENPERLGADPQGHTRLVNVAVVGFLDRWLKDDLASFDKARTTLDEEIGVTLEVVDP